MTAPVSDTSEEWLDRIFTAVQDEALQCGWFDTVNGHEPVSPAGHGLTCGIWVQGGPEPLPEGSGLAASSGLLTFFVRVYTPAQQEPRDEIDPNVAKAVSSLMRRWHGNYDFGLDPLVRNVDLLGQFGTRLRSVAGWVPVPGGGRSRAMTITLPIICNDIWAQEASS